MQEMFKTSMAITPAAAKFAPLLFAGDWRAGLQAAVEFGYDAVEVSLRDPREQVVRDLLDAIEDSGLELSAIATGQSYYNDGLSPTSSDSSVQAELLERMKHFVEYASRWGAFIIIGGVRGTLEGTEEERAVQHRNAIQAIRSYAHHAEAAGVRLVIEPINRYETSFLNTVAEALSFIEDVGAGNLGVLADTFHMNIEESSPADALESAGERLFYVHLPDSNRLAAGQGHIDFHNLAAVLRGIGYDGYLGAEILPLPDSRTAAQLAADFFRTL
jgi:sugar phosphate isomerase/epimerase